jgi:GMP synthase-like glutamine amidotransferase
MKIGLLMCDHVREEFRHIAGDYRDMFPALFAPLAPHWQWHFYEVVNDHFPASPHECDAYLCTGSKFSVYDDEPWIHRLKDFVKLLYRIQKPFVGVCFGHQLLGEALGGKVQKAEVGWCVGVYSFTVNKFTVNRLENRTQTPNPKLQTVNLLMMCQDQIVQLPPDTQVLASTTDCPNAMILVGDSMLGIQAHPEFTVEYEEALMRSRVERIGAEKTERQLKTLTLSLDSKTVAEWIVKWMNFGTRSYGTRKT